MAVMYIKPSSWVEISKSAFDLNISTYKSILDPYIKIGIVIKSNAYGHDTSTMAQLCEQNTSVDYICTNSLSEALLARKRGVTKNLLVISLVDDNPKLAIEKNIRLIGHNFKQIQQFNEIGAKENRKVSIHLKIDTGMTRLGFFPAELLKSIDTIIQMPYINIEGIFTHFAESSKTKSEFTRYQIEQFTKIIDKLDNKGINIPLRHTSNTAGVPQTRGINTINMIRMGAGAFGFYTSPTNRKLLESLNNKFNLTPILTWKTKVFTIKNVPKNRYVGYARTYKTKKNTTLGYLPIGYSDGLDKNLSNKGFVYLSKQKKFVPIVGLICMNMTIIDLTGIPEINEGDEVVLIGNHEKISAQTIDKMVKTESARQVTAQIVSNIPRIIVP